MVLLGAEAGVSVQTTAAQIIALIVVAAAVAGLSNRFSFSAPLALTVVGIAVSFVPGVPEYRLSPELVLAGILPPLLYATAIKTPFVDIARNRRPIALLSVALVLVTAFAVAGVALLVLPDLPVAAAIALGAVVAPPDAVAATAVARRVGMPRRIVTILEGESLLNDATALVTFQTARAAIGASAGAVSLLGAGSGFARAVVVGVAVGLALAAVVGLVRKHLSDPVLDTSLSLLTPFTAFLAAEAFHGSGVLAVVLAGLVLGHASPEIQSASSRVIERTLWRSVVFLLESVVFLLIGLQLRGLLQRADDARVGTIVLLCVAVTLTVIVVRIVWMFPATYLPRLIPGVGRNDPSPPWQHVAILSWAGMRGVVTLAVAFTLTGAEGGVAEALGWQADALALAAFSVVGATLLLQGSSLPWLVRRLGVRGPDPRQDALQQALVLQHAVDAGRARLRDERGDAPDDVVDNLDGWAERVAHAVWERLGAADGERETPARAFRRLRVAMLGAERDVVVSAYRRGTVPPDVVAEVFERLDQEEAMLEGFAAHSVESEEGLLRPEGVPDACEHLGGEELGAAPASTDVCEDCVAMGERNWVHLRMCVRCGHVACCDSSPRRHASAHFAGTSHPVMRSVELGEGWRWCYVDHVSG